MTNAITATAERTINVPATRVYQDIANAELHSKFLTSPFYDFEIENPGFGAGTVIRYKIDFAGGTREIRMKVAEPEPGRVLTHTDTNGTGLITTFTVTPVGRQAIVRIDSRWHNQTGIAGALEKIIAPLRMGAVYRRELSRIDGHFHGA